MNTKNKLLLLSGSTSWSLLGFTRGLDYYDYNYKKYRYKYKTYLYTDRIYDGIMGTCFYIIPPFTLFALSKEIYRLEVNIRGLETEKNSDFYYSFLF